MSKRNRTLLLLGVLLVATFTLSGCMPAGNVYDQPQGVWAAIVSALAHALDFLHTGISGLGIAGAWGWAIIVFTIVIKVVTLPLTFKQLQATRAQQELQPKLSELQQKYGKDRTKLQEEQMKLYKEAGINPLGGCLPLLIQMPILFALYQSLYVLASPLVGKLTGANFLWIPDLGVPGVPAPGTEPPTIQGINFAGQNWLGGTFAAHRYDLLIAYLSLPIIMTLSQLVMQKMSQPATRGKPKSGQPDQTQMMGQMMLFMPVIFGWVTLGLPSGLTLYWTVSNILQLVQQYFVAGWGGLADWIAVLKPKPKPEAALVETVGETSASGPAAPKVKRRRRRK